MSNATRLIVRATWATAALALCVAATGCSSNGGSAGGPATSGAATSSAGAGTTGAASASSTTGSSATGSSASASAAAGSSGATKAASSSTPLPVPSTPVAAPSSGSIHQTVAARTPSAAPSTAITAPVTVSQGVQVKLAVKRITVKTVQPGDTAGPALAVTVTIVNKSAKPVSTVGVSVAVVDAANTPQTPMVSGPVQRIAAQVAAGQTASGVYVFHLRSPKQPVKATVWVSADLPTAVFVGKV